VSDNVLYEPWLGWF